MGTCNNINSNYFKKVGALKLANVWFSLEWNFELSTSFTNIMAGMRT